jgi:hypothetical protein
MAFHTDLFMDIWASLREYVPVEKRVAACRRVILSFMDHRMEVNWDIVADVDSDVWPEYSAAFAEAMEQR